MSRWADTFATLSRSHDTLDTLRHNENPPSECHIVSTVSRPSPSRKRRAEETPAEEALEWNPCKEERAAIVEHDGKIPRAWAEGLARLHADHPPSNVPPHRWRQFVDDVGNFVDRWAPYAAALGWEPLDLFGCDRDRPFARIDQAGLLWLVDGDKLIALTENTAAIERRTGTRQTYRRKPSEPGRVLAWELT